MSEDAAVDAPPAQAVVRSARRIVSAHGGAARALGAAAAGCVTAAGGPATALGPVTRTARRKVAAGRPARRVVGAAGIAHHDPASAARLAAGMDRCATAADVGRERAAGGLSDDDRAATATVDPHHAGTARRRVLHALAVGEMAVEASHGADRQTLESTTG